MLEREAKVKIVDTVFGDYVGCEGTITTVQPIDQDCIDDGEPEESAHLYVTFSRKNEWTESLLCGTGKGQWFREKDLEEL